MNDESISTDISAAGALCRGECHLQEETSRKRASIEAFASWLISRDGGKWWSKDHHLVVVKIVKNVAFSLKNVKRQVMVKESYKIF